MEPQFIWGDLPMNVRRQNGNVGTKSKCFYKKRFLKLLSIKFFLLPTTTKNTPKKACDLSMDNQTLSSFNLESNATKIAQIVCAFYNFYFLP